MVAGRYQIESLLGEGGYGAVYVATQHPLGRKVALKILHSDVLSKPTARERFVREAQLTQQISHPNVVRLFDFGTTEQGMPFIVWELLVGRSIEHELARSGPLSTGRIVRIASQILKALAEAHARGIVHRDIKPANVFLSDFAGEPDFVKVLDFGIAAGPKEGTKAGLTQEGISLGTPAYMPPEQVLDEPLDGRADLYAVGLLMSEMASGVPVFRGEGAMEVAMKQLEDQPAPHSPSVLSSALGPLIGRATQKDPAHRFGSALEMLHALGSVSHSGPQPVPDTLASAVWQHGGGAQHSAVVPIYRAPPFGAPLISHPVAPKSKAALWVVLTVLVSIGVAVAGVAMFARHQSSESQREAKSRAKAATAEQEAEEADPFDQLESEIMKGVVKSLGNMGKCPPLTPKVAAFAVQRLTIEQVLARFISAGYQCVAHNDLGNFGTFMLMRGTRSVTIHYGPSKLVMAKNQANTRSLSDTNGNVIVLQASSDSEAQAAGDLAAGKSTGK